jgi:hypothetical protein
VTTLRFVPSAAAWPALAAALVFANALGGDFQFDDWRDVVGNDAARAESFWTTIAGTVRPLLKATYALNDWIHGAWPAGFIAVNVALHLVNATLVFFLLRHIVAAFAPDARTVAVLSAAAAILWAVHPLATETVTYVSGRSQTLSSALILAALVLGTGLQTHASRATALGCAALAPLARETALILPALLFWLELFRAEPQTWRQLFQRLLPILAGTAIAALVLAALPAHRAFVEFSFASRTPFEALRGNLYAIGDILFYWIAPWRITIDPEPSLAFGWTDVETICRGLALVAALALAVILRKRGPLVTFAIGWTLLTLLPTNSIVWRADPVSIKPLYLASLGFVALVAWIGARVIAKERAGWPFVAIIVATAIALGAMTAHRNALFASPVLLWEDAVTKTPKHARAWLQLAIAYYNAGRDDDANRAIETTLEIEPWNEEAKRLRLLIEAALLEPVAQRWRS